MEAQNLLVDEVTIDPITKTGMVNSTLYEFSAPKWMSFHADREGKRIGPMTILKDEGVPGSLMASSITSFGNRQLVTEGGPENQLILYQDRWTVPFYTIYAFVMPNEFVAEDIDLVCQEEFGSCLPLQLAYNNDHLFFHTIFGEHPSRKHIFEIKTILQFDPPRYKQIKESMEIVEGTSDFQRFGHSLIEEAKNPNFWFRLLEIGSKFLKHGG